MKSLRSCIFIDWESGCNKLMIIDYTSTSDINFNKHAFKIFITHFSVTLANSLTQLVNLNCSRTVCVNLIEFFTQLVEFTRVDHFGEDLQTFPSQSVSSMEVSQTFKNLLTDWLASLGMITLSHLISKPDMCLALSCSRSICVFYSKHLCEQVL